MKGRMADKKRGAADWPQRPFVQRVAGVYQKKPGIESMIWPEYMSTSTASFQ